MTRFITEQERVEDQMEVERLYDLSFGGKARWQRPVYDLRRNCSPIAALCHVVRQKEKEAEQAQAQGHGADEQETAIATAEGSGRIVAALRFWEVRIKAISRGTKPSARAPRLSEQVEKKALLFGPLAVYADMQGKGLGKALVERNIAEAKRLGYGGILHIRGLLLTIVRSASGRCASRGCACQSHRLGMC